MTDSNDNSEGIGRRDAMKAGALAAGGLAIGSVGSQKATAQTNPERLQLGPEWTLDDKDDGSIVLTNEDSGATLEYDATTGQWSVGPLATESLDTVEQNNNEVNLTSLVEDGPYSDICDAIANEPPTNPVGTRHVIEPGTYGPISATGRVIDYGNREIVAYGRGKTWDGAVGDDQSPVSIVASDGATGHLFQAGDEAGTQAGNTFNGITFRPETDGGAVGAFDWRGDVGVQTYDWNFIACKFTGFGGSPHTDSNATNVTSVFGHVFDRCVFTRNGSTSTFGFKNTLRDCAIWSGIVHEVDTRHKANVNGLICATTADNARVIQVGHGSEVHFQNAETTGYVDDVAVTVDGGGNSREHTLLRGVVQGFDYGAVMAGGSNNRIMGLLAPVQIESAVYDFRGGGGNHTGSMITGRITPGDVQFADDLQNVTILPTESAKNNQGDVPVGWIQFDGDRNGTGNPSLIFGGSNQTNLRETSTHYIDFDGSY